HAVVRGRGAGKRPGGAGRGGKDFVYERAFAEKAGVEREFVEALWARRKVGYLLDQIRANGEKKELVDEVIVLAKRYGITTPYTSYLIVPDAPIPVAGASIKSKGKGKAGAGKHGKPHVSFHLLEK